MSLLLKILLNVMIIQAFRMLTVKIGLGVMVQTRTFVGAVPGPTVMRFLQNYIMMNFAGKSFASRR